MSVEVLLIPVVLAAVAARKAKQEADAAGRSIVSVTTRMKDERLLHQAIADTGARVSRPTGFLVGSWPGLEVSFSQDGDGIWSLHAWGEATTPEVVTALAQAVDAAYARRVQEEVVARIRARAPEAGLTVAEETVEDDDTVVLVLNVEAG